MAPMAIYCVQTDVGHGLTRRDLRSSVLSDATHDSPARRKVSAPAIAAHSGRTPAHGTSHPFPSDPRCGQGQRAVAAHTLQFPDWHPTWASVTYERTAADESGKHERPARPVVDRIST